MLIVKLCTFGWQLYLLSTCYVLLLYYFFPLMILLPVSCSGIGKVYELVDARYSVSCGLWNLSLWFMGSGFTLSMYDDYLLFDKLLVWLLGHAHI